MPAPKMIEKNCVACGALMNVRLADHKRGWGRFCDKSCAAGYKCGMRPRDVNKRHAKKSVWAEKAFKEREASGVQEWPKAAPVHQQIGQKVKIKPIYHSPSQCRDCGKPVNGAGRCWKCDAENDAINSMESGWDGHKTGCGA